MRWAPHSYALYDHKTFTYVIKGPMNTPTGTIYVNYYEERLFGNILSTHRFVAYHPQYLAETNRYGFTLGNCKSVTVRFFLQLILHAKMAH